MHRRDNLGHLVLAIVVVLGLTPLMVCVDSQAQIAFSSNREGNWEIYVMDVDGENQQNLSNNPSDDRDPSWSPDGKRIVFLSNRDGFKHGLIITYEVYVMRTDGGNQQRLTENPGHEWDPSWSPDGKRIAFTSDRDGRFNYEIYVMDADRQNEQRLTENPDGDDDRHPSWSPDGERIVFSARRDGHFENKFGITYEIYVMDADGGNQQRLTENRKNDWYPSWSPDGKRIVFASDGKGELQNFEIYVMDADGQNERRLTKNRQNDRDPSWSPDGKRIAFASYRKGDAEIYVMNVNGKNLQNLTNNPHHDDINPAWFNSSFSVSPSGKKFMMWGRLKQLDR